MPRIFPLIPEKLSPAQRRVHDAIVAGPRGKVEGPLRVWLLSPDFAARAQKLGAFCRYKSSLPSRLSELAILTTGAFWKADFEWHAHMPFALKAGLDPKILEMIRNGKKPKFKKTDESTVYQVAHELWSKHRISSALYKRAEKLLGLKTLVELVGILGYYGLISMTIMAFEVSLPKGIAEPFG
jgi:4-carboxymuconolactone decarboxylase